MCGAGIEQHYIQYPDFDDLEEEVRMQYIIEAAEELYSQGLVSYGISTADDNTIDSWSPALDLARQNYETSFE